MIFQFGCTLKKNETEEKNISTQYKINTLSVTEHQILSLKNI